MKKEIEHELHFEPLPTEPVERRPMATKDFKDFKTLAVYSTYLVACNRLRRLHHRVSASKVQNRMRVRVINKYTEV